MRYVMKVPICAQRRPAAYRIASSTSSTVATSSCTSHSASRHSASSRRSATKPSISLRTRRGFMPSDVYSPSARSTVFSDVCSPATTSTRGSRYTGLKGCPTTKRSGWVMSACSRDGKRPEVEEHTSASGRASSSISASSRRLSASFSGALSCTTSASPTASAEGGGERDRAADTGRKRQLGPRALGVLEHVSYPPFRVRMRVGHDHVDPVLDETTCPAAADHTATDDCDAHQARVSRSFSRTSAGPRTPTFIASRIVTARSTSAPFVAFAPRSSQMLSSSPTRTLPPTSGASAT